MIDDLKFISIDKRLSKSLVYAYYTKDNILYIGSAKNGLNRVFDTYHDKRYLLDEELVELGVIFCNSESDARNLELLLIEYYKPKYNKRFDLKAQRKREVKKTKQIIKLAKKLDRSSVVDITKVG